MVLEQCVLEYQNDNILFGAFQGRDMNTMVGRASVSGVSRGASQSAVVGYSVDKNHVGRGYGTEILQGLVTYVFCELELHRLQASVMPSNAASIQVLKKCGFRCEGRALRYLCIRGKWEDHDIYALTAEDLSL